MRDIPMPASDAATAGEIISRIGQLTRMLRDSMRELGLDQAIAQAAEAIPDARDRLDYVVTMTAQAAERALNCVEAAQPRQAELESGANALKGRWDEWFANPIELDDARSLVNDTRQYLDQVPGHTAFTNAQLLEIMMAQDLRSDRSGDQAHDGRGAGDRKAAADGADGKHAGAAGEGKAAERQPAERPAARPERRRRDRQPGTGRRSARQSRFLRFRRDGAPRKLRGVRKD